MVKEDGQRVKGYFLDVTRVKGIVWFKLVRWRWRVERLWYSRRLIQILGWAVFLYLRELLSCLQSDAICANRLVSHFKINHTSFISFIIITLILYGFQTDAFVNVGTSIGIQNLWAFKNLCCLELACSSKFGFRMLLLTSHFVSLCNLTKESRKYSQYKKTMICKNLIHFSFEHRANNLLHVL